MGEENVVPHRAVTSGVLIFLAAFSALRCPGSAFRIHGGVLTLNGTLRCSTVSVAPEGAIAGRGAVDGDLILEGRISPGNPSGSDAAEFTVSGAVEFRKPSRFECTVESSTRVDRIGAGGPITGVGEIRPRRQPAAVPVEQSVLAGSSESEYRSLFVGGADAGDWSLERDAPSGSLLLTYLVGDTDGDRLPDWWELKWFGDRTAAVFDEDSDGDGAVNLQEKIAGTSPVDRSDVLALRIAPAAPGWIWLMWPSVSGRVYAVEQDLDAGFASPAILEDGLSAAPPTNFLLNATGGSPEGFYRVGVREE